MFAYIHNLSAGHVVVILEVLNIIREEANMSKPYYNYVHGAHNKISDRNGFKYKSTEMRREWNHSLVHTSEFETRHPQDFVRGIADHQAVRDPRPGGEIFLDVDTTTDADEAAGQTVISVTSTANFTNGNTIYIELDNDSLHRTTISSFVANDTVTIASAIPYAATSGNKVTVVKTTLSAEDL